MLLLMAIEEKRKKIRCTCYRLLGVSHTIHTLGMGASSAGKMPMRVFDMTVCDHAMRGGGSWKVCIWVQTSTGDANARI